jgi:hypothetical protein
VRSHTESRRIVACQIVGGPDTWLYLSSDLRGRYGGYDLSQFNDRAVKYAALSDLDAETRKGFDAVAESVGLGMIDWTNLRVTEIHSVRSEQDTRYNALTEALLAPEIGTFEDAALIALAEICRAGAENPGTIKIEALERAAAALDQLRRERETLRDRVETLETRLAESEGRGSAPLWLAATPPDLPTH